VTARATAALVRKEARELFLGRAYWPLLLGLSLLVGASFRQALALYSEASRAATTAPELARGLSPFDGILVPTFGALYLTTTLLWPFVAIRQLASDRASGAFRLLVQTPLGLPQQLTAKMAALAAGLGLALLIPLSAVAFWRLLGGHVAAAELAGLVAGHLLYAVVVAALALAAAACTDSAPTASLFVLGATLGSWALDFAAAGQDGLLARLGAASLTRVLRPWEQGLFVLGNVVTWSIAALALVGIAAIGLKVGWTTRRRLVAITALVLAAVVVAGAGARLRLARDYTEDRRNSFAPEVEAALQRIRGPVRVEVYLAAEDPRSHELERAVLSKLRRTVAEIAIVPRVTPSGAFGAVQHDRYGEVVYSYGGRSDVSRSTSPREVVPLLLGLAGERMPAASASGYPGYPLVARDRWSGLWFFGLVPAMIVAGATVRWWPLITRGGGG
jgi:hypothetical protein